MDILQAGARRNQLLALNVFKNVDVVELAPYRYGVWAWRKTWIKTEGAGVEGYLWTGTDSSGKADHQARWNTMRAIGSCCNTSDYQAYCGKVYGMLVDMALAQK